MPKHNNVVPNSHFHKEWSRGVRTWFDQAAKKRKRSGRRVIKAARIFPRPAHGPLRSIVHCPTLRHQLKKRLGRGFTLTELQAAGIPRKQARGIGISVNHRRRNRSEEGFQENVQLLKKYKANLILFPRQPKPQQPILSTVEQQRKSQMVPASKFHVPKAIKPEQSKTTSFTILRRARVIPKVITRKNRAALRAERRGQNMAGIG